MMLWTLLGLLVLWAPAPAGAACRSCTGSRGVEVTLKNGSSVKGYVAWSPRHYEAFFGPYGRRFDKAARPLLKEKGWSLKQRVPSGEAFARWVEILDYAFKNGVWEDSRTIDPLTVYRRLEKINHPIKKFMAIEGRVTRVAPGEIAKIAAAPDLDLVVDTTGIGVLPLEDALRLQREAPRFTVSHEHGLRADVYAVYGPGVSKRAVLDHLLHENKGSLFDVKIDGVLLDDCADLDCVQFASDKRTFHEARSREVASCRAPARKLLSGMRTARDPKERAELKREAYATLRRCEAQEGALLDRHAPPLGDAATLRKMGVVRFSYAWE